MFPVIVKVYQDEQSFYNSDLISTLYTLSGRDDRCHYLWSLFSCIINYSDPDMLIENLWMKDGLNHTLWEKWTCNFYTNFLHEFVACWVVISWLLRCEYWWSVVKSRHVSWEEKKVKLKQIIKEESKTQLSEQDKVAAHIIRREKITS